MMCDFNVYKINYLFKNKNLIISKLKLCFILRVQIELLELSNVPIKIEIHFL